MAQVLGVLACDVLISKVMATNQELANDAHYMAALFGYAGAQIAHNDRVGYEAMIARALRELDAAMDRKAATA